MSEVTIKELAITARQIWGAPMGMHEIVPAMGVVFGDICRYTRDDGNPEELKKEFGNMILSTIRWCDDQGFDAEECIIKAIECQQRFVAKHSQPKS